MKRILFTLFFAVLFFACATAQTKHGKGAEFPNLPTSTTVPVGGNLIFTDPGNDGLTTGISVADLSAQLNISAGNLSQEEVEDIIAAAFTGATHTGASFTYDDVNGTIGINVTGGGGGADGNDFPTAATLAGTILTITIPNQSDVQIDLAALQDGIGTDDQTIDILSLNGTNLELSLEGDGEANQTVDLAPLQDGTGTDNQTIDKLNLNGTTLEISLEGDGEADQTVDLSGLGGGGGVTVDNTLQNGSANPVENDAIFDRFATVIDEEPTSPNKMKPWSGTKAQLYAQFGNPPTGLDPDGFYIVTDSIPSTPPGGGDMVASTFDSDGDDVVDDSEALGGVAAANYGQIIEATFTPTLKLGSTTITTTTADGYYYQVGKMVHFYVLFNGVDYTGTPGGALTVGNLPVNIDNYATITLHSFVETVAGLDGIYPINSSATDIVFYKTNASVRQIGQSSILRTDLDTLPGQIIISGIYITD